MDKNKDKLVETLIRGRDSAKRLQNLLGSNVDNDGSVSVDDLVTEVMGSFSGVLSVLNSCNSADRFNGVPLSPRVGFACSVDRVPDTYSGDTKKNPAPAVKGRRGCYTRRRFMDSRVKTSGTTEDGYAWRKYGQKEILNSKFPRCYFRCAHKYVLGCKASKQVQKLEDESNMFHITYFGHHTCPPPNTSSHHGLILDCNDSKIQQNLRHSPFNITNIHIDALLEQDHSSPYDAEPSLALVWKEIMINDQEPFKNDGFLEDISFADVFFS